MTSAIDPTVPVAGNPTTASVRANFATAQSEITALQNDTTGAPFLPLGGGQMQGIITLHNDPTGPMQPVTLGYFQANGGGGPGSGGIPDAPADGTLYGRQDGAWLHAVNTAELNAAVAAAPYLPLSGGILTGMLTLSGAPTAPLHPATKGYTDTTFLALSGGTLNGNLSMGAGTTLTLAQNASAPLQPVSLQQLQAGYLPLTGGILSGNLSIGTGFTMTLAQNAASGLQAVPLQQLTAGYLPLSGGALTGLLTTQQVQMMAGCSITPPSGGAGITFRVVPGAGNPSLIMSQVTPNLMRWTVTLNDGAAETGSNNGSGFNISRYSDAGAMLDTPFLINRNSGIVQTNQFRVYGYPNIGFRQSGGNTRNISMQEGSWEWAWNTGTGTLYWICNGNYYFTFDAGGNLQINGTLTQGSDARSKTNIADYAPGLAEVMQLQPRTWEKDGKTGAGFVAQEVEIILPEAVIIVPDPAPSEDATPPAEQLPDRRYMTDTPILAAVVSAVQELHSRITQLETARM